MEFDVSMHRKKNISHYGLSYNGLSMIFQHMVICGCSVKWYKVCPTCGEKTTSIRLQHGEKNSYIGHMKYLPRHYPYRIQFFFFFMVNKSMKVLHNPCRGRPYTSNGKDMIFSCEKKCGKTLSNEGVNDYWKIRS